jgi:RNA polymerase sigma factor (sigma-70 family)
VREISDKALIEKCRQGSDSAWETLVSRYERLVYTIPLRYGLTQSEADDVFQSVWLTLIRHLPTLKQPERVSAWLVTTAKHACWDKRRGAEFSRSYSTDPIEMPERDEPAALLPEAVVAQFEQHQSLREAMNKLGKRCRRLLQALYYDPSDPSYAEIGARLEMPAGAIGPNRARCLKKLRELWQS